ncbi:hypothetical protein D918_04885 [Trichuris suis]|nr:hypothetical protein D918_04885 [Trichuris suis]
MFQISQTIPLRYPVLSAAIEKLVIAIPSSSAVERAFSVLRDFVTKELNRLDVANQGDLRLQPT